MFMESLYVVKTFTTISTTYTYIKSLIQSDYCITPSYDYCMTVEVAVCVYKKLMTVWTSTLMKDKGGHN